MFLEPGADPAVARQMIGHSADSRTLLVWVSDAHQAAEVAALAVDEHGCGSSNCVGDSVSGRRCR
ncbi:hypothetical protein [Lentzea sp. NPDC051838]|uniref:hypothetical protein n=1 Tax=Lentzea sp. NPDC051838 TaxID=3154849 RepID=UPI003421A1E2